MNNKYLPIGTIVKLKSIDKQIMIIGYYSIEYQNSVKIFDYVGCSYPEGMLIKNNSYSFNHSDIEKIEYIGYKNESYINLNNNLNNQKTSGVTKSNAHFSNFKFDANGVVIYEEPVSNELTNDNVSDEINIRNPFEYTTSESPKSNAPTINYKFDKNGVVVEDPVAKKDIKEINNNFTYIFDDNGNVISETSNANPKKSENTYQFDKSGNVISETSNVNQKKSENTYQFDKNGNVISESNKVNNEIENLELPRSKSVKKEKYKFDANGMVIEVN